MLFTASSGSSEPVPLKCIDKLLQLYDYCYDRLNYRRVRFFQRFAQLEEQIFTADDVRVDLQ